MEYIMLLNYRKKFRATKLLRAFSTE